MAEMKLSNVEAAIRLEVYEASLVDGAKNKDAAQMKPALRSGASALRRLDELEKWIDKWLAWNPPAIEGNDTGRMWRTHQSKVMLKSFKAALTGDMPMPPETQE